MSIFSGNFTKNSIFAGHISEEFRFLGNFTNNLDFLKKNSEKFRFFSGNFTKKSIKFRFFKANFRDISIFQAKIGYLQLFLGKLFYCSSKVTTFEHTSCT